MTDTFQLERLCAGVPGFLGVFASNMLPATVRPRSGGSSLIVNYSPESSGGTHWVAMGRLQDTTGAPAEYFDSFGEPPDGDDTVLAVRNKFREYLLANSRGAVMWNPFDLQGVKSNVCGQYAGFYIHAGCLPRLEAGGEPYRFRQPWGVLEYVTEFRGRPTAARLRVWSMQRDEKAANRNDTLIRRWAVATGL